MRFKVRQAPYAVMWLQRLRSFEIPVCDDGSQLSLV